MFGPTKRDLLRVIERERVQHRAEIGGLLDRIADLSGRPWTLPPRPVVEHDLTSEEAAERDYLARLEEL